MGKQLMIKPEKCIGCRTCELVCSFGHDQAFNPRNANVTVMAYEEAAINIPVMCLQCEDPCCLEVCPVGAISRDEIGAVVMDHAKCIGCKMCMNACPLGNISFNKEKKQVFSSSQSSSLPFRFLNSRGCIPTPFTDLSENLIGSAPFLLVQAEQSSAVLLHKLAVHQYALPHGETAAPSWSGFFPGRSPYTWSPG